MRKLSSYNIKIIAIGTMFLDHIFALFGTDFIDLMIELDIYSMFPFILYLIISSIGRLAFPLFAFMIAEGCYYTKDMKKYISRLLILGIISEIPFQYFIAFIQETPHQFSFTLQNVFFTLALGALAIEGYRRIEAKNKSSILSFIPVMLCAVIAYLLHTDYDFYGVLFIFFLYIFRDSKFRYFLIFIFSFGLYIVSDLWTIYAMNIMDIYYVIEAILRCSFACLSGLLIYYYNHERGKPMKWLFYFFYPIHIILLCSLYTMIH